MKNFTMFCQKFENYLFTKDVGIISYIMQKYYGYSSKIRCKELVGEAIDDKKYLDNIDFKVISTEEEEEEMLKSTDVLMMVGIYETNMHMIMKYKSLNPNGKIYLKLDANPTWMFGIYKNMNPQLQECLDKCDIISIENRRMQSILRVCFERNIEFIINGHYDFTHSPIIDYSQKENTILFAGRVGDPSKSNELLIEAFKNISDCIPNWNLELAGNVEDSFLMYLSFVFKQKPELKSRIKLTGRLDKNELKKSFQKAKIFCLTSPSEACAHVLSEAIYNGCYLISTDVDGAIDVIDYGRYGQLFPVNDVASLERCLLEACNNQEMLKDNCEKSQKYALENLSWIRVCGTLDTLLSQ